ncbi:MAG: helix-hairpin-helix domain-containing protein, partial [Actinomycetota bacterium]
MPSNRHIAQALDILADMMELDGANIYKTIAHRKAARRVAESNFSIKEMADAGTLTELPDIGDAIAAKIRELIDTGRLAELDEYKQKFPPDLVRIQKVHGIGPKTARKVWDQLGVSSLDELEEAGREGRIAGLPGMGQRTEENVLKAIKQLKERGTRLLLGEALPVAEEVTEALASLPEARNVTCAGSVRRMKETVKDIDIIATASEPGALTKAFSTMPIVEEVTGLGTTKCSIRTYTGIQIDLRVVPDDQYGSLLQHFTGSAEHNVALRELAIEKGLKVSEYGVEETATGKMHHCSTEAEVYRLLGLEFIPPELREDRGEIEAAAAGGIPVLIEAGDLKGDLHVHSDWSDGNAGIRDMALAARDRGFKFIAIADHSQSLAVARGLTPKRLKQQLEEIAELNEEL